MVSVEVLFEQNELLFADSLNKRKKTRILQSEEREIICLGHNLTFKYDIQTTEEQFHVETSKVK